MCVCGRIGKKVVVCNGIDEGVVGDRIGKKGVLCYVMEEE